MKTALARSKAWWKRQRSVVKAGIILVAAVVLIVLLKGKPDEGSTIETVKQQTLSRTVTASGTVVSSTDLSLSFESSKMIDSVKVKVGDVVKKGDILATEKSASERASYNAARGTLLAARARYDKVLEGSSNEQIALADVAYKNAQKDFDNVTKVQNGLVENARRKLNSDGLVAENNTTTMTAPTISGTYTGAEGSYTIVVNAAGGDGSYVTFSGIESGIAKASTAAPQTLGTKGLSILFPAGGITPGTWTIKIPNTSSISYVSNQNAYTSAQNSRDAAIASAQAAVDSAEAQLNLQRATARQPEVDAALADIVSASAQVEQATAVLEKAYLRAPADGTITRVNVKVGEVPEAMKEAMVIQDVSNLYLEASINESNIDELTIGQPVNVTFDAISGDTYHATVSSIDPAATIANNVVNYKIKALLETSENIRPGMTANMSVVTKQVPDALVIPGRAVTGTEGSYHVVKITNTRKKTTTNVPVEIGIKGDGDLWQVVSGLMAGDQVLWVPQK